LTDGNGEDVDVEFGAPQCPYQRACCGDDFPIAVACQQAKERPELGRNGRKRVSGHDSNSERCERAAGMAALAFAA
jgi:hypothetical protein